MPNGTYGGVRGKETKVGQKTFVSRPTRLLRPGRFHSYLIKKVKDSAAFALYRHI